MFSNISLILKEVGLSIIGPISRMPPIRTVVSLVIMSFLTRVMQVMSIEWVVVTHSTHSISHLSQTKCHIGGFDLSIQIILTLFDLHLGHIQITFCIFFES
ncbi:MAG: hypothetical protein [Circular genetic element sp.]|nr:MAG: hypothetical protein [Circular genetic element sp.]